MFSQKLNVKRQEELTLAATWNPRGELKRFERSLPFLKEIYTSIAISFPPVTDPAVTELFINGVYAAESGVRAVKNHEWSWGRYIALKLALDTSCAYIQYADMDRMLRWVETYPDELRVITEAVKGFDCVIIGRTEKAYRTHPQALRETEAISNMVASYFLGRKMDLSAGAKGFSRRAAQYIVDHCTPGDALGADSEWPIMLNRAGFEIKYLTADGLTWESADRYQDYAAAEQELVQAALLYDREPENWAYRVSVANEIVRKALETSLRVID